MKLHIGNSIVIENNGRKVTFDKGEYEFDSASEFIKFIEGLGEQPKEPLIKDEKIRKAVRAWAELHGVKSVRYATYTYYTELANLKAGSGSNGVYMDIVALPELEDGKCYTIAELCGEEEE